MRQTGVAARVTSEAFLFFGVACLIYLVLAIISSFGINAIERAVGQTERHAMSTVADAVADVERPPPPARGWPRERIAGHVLVGLVDHLLGLAHGRHS